MTRSQRRWILFAAVMWIVSGSGLVGTARSEDLQVNTYTTNGQYAPSVSIDDDGDFVVVWDSLGSGGTDSSGFSRSIQGQRYASGGAAVGGQFQVNTYTTGDQYNPRVALDADGDLVVVWQSYLSATDSDRSIQGQRYASDGATVGGQFQVNTYTTSYQGQPSVGLGAGGDFVVVWQSYGSGGTDSSFSIQGQRYASDGATVGSQFQVNTYTTSGQFSPSVGLDADGDFVVVWVSDGSGGTDSSFSIQGQRYASNGATVGSQFQVNTYTTSAQYGPKVGLEADGDFVVVWQSDGSGDTDSSSDSIQGQRYAADGATVGSQFQVNTYTTSGQQQPSVDLDADGDFVVVWQSYGSGGTDSSSFSIQGQRYASDGATVGSELQVNTYTTSSQPLTSVGLDADGDFVVVWQSNGSGGTDSSGYSIQKSDLATVPVELVFFAIE